MMHFESIRTFYFCVCISVLSDMKKYLKTCRAHKTTYLRLRIFSNNNKNDTKY